MKLSSRSFSLYLVCILRVSPEFVCLSTRTHSQYITYLISSLCIHDNSWFTSQSLTRYTSACFVRNEKDTFAALQRSHGRLAILGVGLVTGVPLAVAKLIGNIFSTLFFFLDGRVARGERESRLHGRLCSKYSCIKCHFLFITKTPVFLDRRARNDTVRLTTTGYTICTEIATMLSRKI